uniref:coat protein n=1 Tax=Leviviridae sp. TaxID=2027243 RepID=UPI001652B718|nr:Chain AA, coat protein [Leviviridae sp.]6YFR_AB Chain AB, coat protein [Leviviridae sp.]6YFR_AC Chain AC, coat protein [Leviviridae sp.]6YFR_AD Chain AD, coat protein [Leviviridae sp.]6YFR_AE Chain AE, coat protein [Leviviridae sp.]6YFR_AF Chain AF, coat protein [Leviviridae sp.]6YFR_AG Chain AG, coat protein [Leviviridae sp.]6YFR_AH Chain AH, coat protein [Leviviridae sp.]6YFR_AI Chain AI, coat protein [Leviviridae sp.]6YFR_AJ Chain AJ, coat protein [Leviviridae sp.]6YFR_AK Chain AK, 
ASLPVTQYSPPVTPLGKSTWNVTGSTNPPGLVPQVVQTESINARKSNIMSKISVYYYIPSTNSVSCCTEWDTIRCEFSLTLLQLSSNTDVAARTVDVLDTMISFLAKRRNSILAGNLLLPDNP